jgi:hypothetical protein
MPRFPFATYAKLLPADRRDVFAAFSRGPLLHVQQFVETGLARAERGLSVSAAPRR